MIYLLLYLLQIASLSLDIAYFMEQENNLLLVMQITVDKERT